MTEAENFDIEEQADTNEQLDALQGFGINDLRKIAGMFKIKASRDWGKVDYIDAIKRAQDSNAVTNFVFNDEAPPKNGYARIMIHRDPTPGHKNSSVHLAFNGMIIGVPRGIKVDVPKPFIEVLENAKTTTVEQISGDDLKAVYRDEVRTSYPFQVFAVAPGDYINSNDNRAAGYAKRKKFFDAYGAWPTDGELKEWNKARMNKDIANEKN